MPRGNERNVEVTYEQFKLLCELQIYRKRELVGYAYALETLKGVQGWEWEDLALSDEPGSVHRIQENPERIYLELTDEQKEIEAKMFSDFEGKIRKTVVNDFKEQFRCLPSESEIISHPHPLIPNGWEVKIQKRSGTGIRTSAIEHNWQERLR